MKIRSLVLLAAACTAAAWAFASFQGSSRAGQIGVDTTVFDGDEAVVMLPPQAIAPGGAMSAEWSPTGKSVLLVRQRVPRPADLRAAYAPGGQGVNPLDFQPVLWGWNRASGKCTELMRVGTTIESLTWVGNTDAAAAVVSERAPNSSTLFRAALLFPLTGKTLPIPLPEGETSFAILGNPVRPLVALIGLTGEDVQGASMWATVFDSTGRRLRRIPLEHGFDGWTPDGSKLYSVSSRLDRTTKKRSYTFRWIDPLTGEATESVEVPKWFNDLMKPPAEEGRTGLRIEALNASPTDKGKTLRALYLMSAPNENPNAALITVDAEWAELSPTQDAVVYSENGVPIVREFARMPKDFYRKTVEAAERAKAVNHAKQAALAHLMYATDYDDHLVFDRDNWVEWVLPYSKDASILNSFVFTYNGPSNLADAKDPAAIELGYVKGPGGRAIAYLDGHVKWVADP